MLLKTFCRHVSGVFLLLIILDCRSNTKKIPQQNIYLSVPEFNIDSALFYLRKQLSFGPRYVNSSGHEACKNWLSSFESKTNFYLVEQPFIATSYRGEDLHGTNLIFRHKPEVIERLLLCAHWDTRPFADKDTLRTDEPIAGADDGASGVAVILEIMRQIATNPIPMGLDIVFFDAEDYGSDQGDNDYSWGLGSQYWSKNLHEDPYEVKYGILLDMVGARNATFTKEGFSAHYAAKEQSKIWNMAAQMGYGTYFVNDPSPAITDDHRFIIEYAGIPVVNIINLSTRGEFGSHHHTHRDDIDIIDPKVLKAVGQVALSVIYNESNGTL